MSRQAGKAEEECPHKQEMLRTNVLTEPTAATSSSRRDHYWLQGVRSDPDGPFRPRRFIQVQKVLAVGPEDTVWLQASKYGGVRHRLRHRTGPILMPRPTGMRAQTGFLAAY